MGEEDKKKILLIDDEEDLAEMTAFQLKANGYDVAVAHDGLEGLERLKEFKPDLIILDMNMPRMGGVEFYENILGPDNRPEYAILVLTARANLEEFFSQLNVEGFMTKPFELEDLLKEVKIILEKDKGDLKKKDDDQPKKIMIVENDQNVLNTMSLAFLNAEHTVIAAKSGAQAFEKIKSDQPDVMIVKMGLSDLAGDQVIAKLKHMPCSQQTKFVLYFPKGSAGDPAVAEKISRKAGADSYVETDNSNALLKEVESLF